MQMRWQTKRRNRRRELGKWGASFASGILVIVLIKSQLLGGGQGGLPPGQVESAPILQEYNDNSGKTSGQAAAEQQQGSKAVQGKAAQANTGEKATNPPAGGSGKSVGAGQAAAARTYSDYERMQVRVFVTEDKRIETLPIEFYVRGVLAGEMPVDFELEALKAQAIAARTYIYRRLKSEDTSGNPTVAADVTDTVQHQVYVPLKTLLTQWKGEVKEANLAKLTRAVEETKGMIITYGGEPIQAAFFSTSNGYTENSGDYWSTDIPYLQSVTSPWDKAISPRYKASVTMKLSAAASKLGVKKNAVASMRVLNRTEGKRIGEIAVGGKTFSGREVREKLELASSQFEWKIDGDDIVFTTYGFGHGVGMSQWGANGMAQAGSTAKQILAHYYSGTAVEQAMKLPDRL
ncbi:stage II sporulation protein D [Paenibacillus phyllosphaerae]|uniref:Stage II sporulation protein D n=2 Tax=Paenibacillus phyllosphaerae TaxID=274593 RepID=A0A7W5FMW8_9BACL|nr:stage II sporulation protein D [Paenibacillus phyllosphaerae]